MAAENDRTKEAVDPLALYMQANEISGDTEQFAGELCRHVKDTIDNRIATQAGSVPNELLYQYAENIFSGSDSAKQLNQATQSEKCVLEVTIHRAEGLAPKDVTGTSDPYCILGLTPNDAFTNFRHKKHTTKYVTSIKMKNLNPVWNECLEIPVRRDQIRESFLHIQVWDYDEAGSMTSAFGALKDVKGVRGVGRYMKEVAQTMSKKDDNDDFMGFSAMPLKNIPLEGIDKWYSMRSYGALQGITGRIKISLRLTCPRVLTEDRGHPGKNSEQINGNRPASKYPDEILYGGILLLIVNGRHNFYKECLMMDEDSKSVDGWDGQLQKVDESLLLEFVTQRKVDNFACAVAKWEVYTMEHTALPDGIQMQRLTALLKDLETQSNKSEDKKNEFVPLLPIAGRGEKPTVFTAEKLSKSFDMFLRHCHNKIANHTVMYPIKQEDTIVRLGELLICMKTLREMKLYLTARLVDTTMFGSGDISRDISDSLRKGMIQMYQKLCVQHKVISANIANLDDGHPIDEYNVPGLVQLVDELHTCMVHGQGYYHLVFKKVLNIDYMAVVLGVISSQLAEDLRNILDKVNRAISAVPDPTEEDSSDKSASMFQLYLSLRDFADYIKQLTGHKITNDEDSNLRLDDMTDGKDEVSTHVDSMKGYHNWFRPTILRWLQMSRGRIVMRLTAAVKLDKVERMDDIVKHSSSAVDAIACLNSVITFWLKLRWPDPMDAFLIATRMTEDISNGVELYADLVHNKLREVGFFDEEGQFDVTEELCLALNNLEKVKLFLDDVLRDMEIEALAAQIDSMNEGPSGQKMMVSFDALVRNAESGMRKKIQEVIAVVGKKMQPDIKKCLEEFSTLILKVPASKIDTQPLNGHDSDYALDERAWNGVASDAINPLMKYLTTNIITLKEWLCETTKKRRSNFHLVLDVIWKVCLQSLREVSLLKHKSSKPYFFRQCKYVLQEHLTAFFHAEGEGLQLEKMHSVDEYIAVDTEYKMRSASSKDLMRLFFSQMYEEQLAQENNAVYGHLNIHAWYDRDLSEVKVDVISAESLVPQDLNGMSDPFVQITLMPKMMFPTLRTLQTLEKKKTLNPFYEDESFTFKVDHELVTQEGAVIDFTVLDYDMIGKNDLEGECILPLHLLDGVSRSTGGRGNRNYRLPLTQPKPKSSSSSKHSSPTKSAPPSPENQANGDEVPPPLVATPLELLRERIHFDRDASEFCWWRTKVQSAVECDEGNQTNFIKQFLS